MACHIEMEMNSCLTEMEKLQAKIMELQKEKELMEQQKQKRLEKQKEEKKTNEVEPNLGVMEKWLDTYYENEEHYECCKGILKAVDEYKKRITVRTEA